MTPHRFEERPGRDGSGVGPGLAGPGLLRQLGNGLGGLIVLMLSGLILMIVVLWKSP